MKISMLILGGFCIAYNLTNFLHELGHGVAVWLSGGSVASIVLNPFSWNWISYNSNPSPLFASWGGMLFGVIFAVIITMVAILIRSPYLVPMYLLAGCAMAVNGIYFSVAAFANVGDAGYLIRHGVPHVYVIGVGLALLILSFLWTSLSQSLIGIPSDTPFRRRLLTLHLGITPYLIAMVVYVLLFDKSEAPLFLAFVGVGILAITVIAVSGHLLRNVAVGLFRLRYVKPTWASVILLLVLGVAVVIGELIYFAS